MPDNSAEFFIGTVNNWTSADGAVIQLDGQASPSTKAYKVLQTSRPVYPGRRYLIMKQSGTYIVLGEIGMPTTWQRIATVDPSADLSTVIARLKLVIVTLRNQGILYPPLGG